MLVQTRFALRFVATAMSDVAAQVAVQVSALAVLVAEQAQKLAELTERVALISAHLSEYGEDEMIPSVDLEGKPVVIR